jgi:hypothetical protein
MLPFELRARLAYDKELLGGVGRIFVDTVLGWYTVCATRILSIHTISREECGLAVEPRGTCTHDRNLSGESDNPSADLSGIPDSPFRGASLCMIVGWHGHCLQR